MLSSFQCIELSSGFMLLTLKTLGHSDLAFLSDFLGAWTVGTKDEWYLYLSFAWKETSRAYTPYEKVHGKHHSRKPEVCSQACRILVTDKFSGNVAQRKRVSDNGIVKQQFMKPSVCGTLKKPWHKIR